MKITGTGSVSPQTPSRTRASGGGFSVSAGGAGPVAASAPAPGMTGVSSVDALLALQQADTPEERRRRAVNRGTGLLDRLDALKLAMLEGGDGAAALQSLARSVAASREAVEEPGLRDVLDHIETRAAVELAKAKRFTA